MMMSVRTFYYACIFVNDFYPATSKGALVNNHYCKYDVGFQMII